VFGLFLPGTSFADFSLTSAAVSCDNGKSWNLIAVDIPNDNPDSVAIPANYRILNGKNRLTCKVGEAEVNASVSVYPPSSHGMGMGTGYVSIDRFTVNGLPILPGPKPFNWSIPGSGDPLVKVSVFLKNNVTTVEICTSEKCYQQATTYDVFMNEAYKKYMAVLTEAGRKQLRQEQRFWLKERDPTCRYVVLSERNKPMAFFKCSMSSTRIRSMRLEDMRREYVQ